MVFPLLAPVQVTGDSSVPLGRTLVKTAEQLFPCAVKFRASPPSSRVAIEACVAIELFGIAYEGRAIPLGGLLRTVSADCGPVWIEKTNVQFAYGASGGSVLAIAVHNYCRGNQHRYNSRPKGQFHDGRRFRSGRSFPCLENDRSLKTGRANSGDCATSHFLRT